MATKTKASKTSEKQWDDTNRGVLFVNDKDGNEARPDFTGKINVNGEDYRIAAWKKESKAGGEFLSISVSEFTNG